MNCNLNDGEGIIVGKSHRKGIRVIDRKLLWARSGNICAFPECRVEITQDFEDDSAIIGEEAHIVAYENDGPRGDST